MANTITTHTIVSGSRNLILQFNIVADGSGNFSNYEILNLDDYQNEGDVTTNDFSVRKLSGRSGVGTSFQLKFGSSTNDHKLFFESSTDNEFSSDYGSGGLQTNLVTSDRGVRLSTIGFDAANDAISLVIWLKKKK